MTSFLWRCSRCGNGYELLVRLPGGDLCGGCAFKVRAGPKTTTEEVFAQEQRTRERMTQRGSTDRHLVRAGKS